MDEEQIRTITRSIGLDLPAERLTQLVGTLATLRAGMVRLREEDPGDAEPPCITYDEEAIQ